MTPYNTKPHHAFEPIPVHDSSTEEEEDRAQGPWFNRGASKRVPVEIYLPPTGIDYITRDGKWIWGTPVWDQDSAKKALDALIQSIRDYLYGNNSWAGNIDLAKLFDLAERLTEVTKVVNVDANK